MESGGDYIFLIVVLYIHKIKKKLSFTRQVSGFKEMAQNMQSLNLFIFKAINIRKTNTEYQQEF